MEKTAPVTIEAHVDVPVAKAWEFWTSPGHITKWNFASDDWHCPNATGTTETGERFSWRMEARDGSMGFDFSGKYLLVEPRKRIVSLLDDGRRVEVRFSHEGTRSKIVETFEPESMNPIELQQQGWQAILNNFKRYAESAI